MDTNASTDNENHHHHHHHLARLAHIWRPPPPPPPPPVFTMWVRGLFAKRRESVSELSPLLNEIDVSVARLGHSTWPSWCHPTNHGPGWGQSGWWRGWVTFSHSTQSRVKGYKEMGQQQKTVHFLGLSIVACLLDYLSDVGVKYRISLCCCIMLW